MEGSTPRLTLIGNIMVLIGNDRLNGQVCKEISTSRLPLTCDDVVLLGNDGLVLDARFGSQVSTPGSFR